jgi:hypothetical protein
VETVHALPVYQGKKCDVMSLECAEIPQGVIVEGDIFDGSGERQGETAQVLFGNRAGAQVIAYGKPRKGG